MELANPIGKNIFLGGVKKMKSTGIVRKLDQLGRIVIPKELRRTLNINLNDGLEIFIEEEKIILKKYVANRACIITGEVLDSNIEYAPGVILSPIGKGILLRKMAKTEI